MTQIKIYDSLQGEKVPFESINEGKITMYVCGPTVYDNAHLGHGRSAVAFDLIRRFLEFIGYKVNFTFNTTDIDDKMIKRANEEGISVAELAEKIIPEYKKDYAALGIKPPTNNPRATEHIEDMINLIKKLEEKGCIYTLDDGVYFDIKTFPAYGKLSHQKLEELDMGARIETKAEKKNPQDFVLWKFKKEGEPSWPSPWGEGRPGWHIECSSMSQTILGETIDIHGGGLDLKFPHHECEIAQSEAASEKPFAKYWMHNGYITINKEKMSKSLGNFFTLKEIFEKYDPRIVRFFLLSTHYRSPIEYSDEPLEQARQTLKGLDDWYIRNREKKGKDEKLLEEVIKKMSNDFDVAGTLATIFEWTKEDPEKVSGTIEELNKFLNIFPTEFELNQSEKDLITEREQARKEKNWKRADEIRDKLLEEGIELEDGANGSFAKPRL